MVMSTIPDEAETASTRGDLPENLLFDYAGGADIILCSQDGRQFRVPKTSIINNSPILGELIQKALDSLGDANSKESLPVVRLPERSQILHCLLTFIFPVTPLVPSTPEEVMELLSVAQKYHMLTALTHIRGSIARQNSLPTNLGSALHIYALAQKYGLLPEALQTARTIFNYPVTIEVFHNKLDIMPGAVLYELWNYYERVRTVLASDLTDFRMSCARDTIIGLHCTDLSSSQVPLWLDQYIESIGENMSLFDYAELSTALARHTKMESSQPSCLCASISSQTIRGLWEALASVVHGSFKKVTMCRAKEILGMLNHLQEGSTLSLMWDQEEFQPRINQTPSPPEIFDTSDTNLIIRSCDLIDFRVHKSILATASPFFKDLLSLPQPSDGENVDGLPMVQLSESSELLNALLSILYPIRTVIPNSYDKVLHFLANCRELMTNSDHKVLYLLAACQKYEMASVQSTIRAEVKRGKFPVPKGAEAFPAYAIASRKGLIPEMESAARQTLESPMTFEVLGEGLRLFEGAALRDLASFRKRCRDSLVTCLILFQDIEPSGPSSIWVGCPEVMPASFSRNRNHQPNRALPRWLTHLFQNQVDLEIQTFTLPLDIHLRIRQEYLMALQKHTDCLFCLGVHVRNGVTFCAELEKKLAQARDKVQLSL